MLRMKGRLALTALLLVALCLCGAAQGEEVLVDGPWTYVVQEDGTAMIAQHWGDKPLELVYPETVNGLTVTAVQLQSVKGVTSVTIPDSVVRVTGSCFGDTLTEFRVSETHPVLETVDGVLFDKTTRTLLAFPVGSPITDYAIPEGTLAIGAHAFADCRGLKAVTIPGSVTVIGDYAFDDVRELKELNIPDSVTSIGAKAFNSCRKLTIITLGAGVEMVPVSAFSNCGVLQRIDVAAANPVLESRSGILINKVEKKLICCPMASAASDAEISRSLRGIEIIGDYAFENSGLRTLDIPQSVTSIGEKAFYSNSSLTQVTIPASVTEIGSEVFTWCKKLETVTLEPGLKVIGEKMFTNCSALREIALPASVMKIGAGAFNGCKALTKVTLEPGLTVLGSRAFASCTALEEIAIPSSLRRIGSHAFGGCTSLRTVTLEPGLSVLSRSMFEDCTALEEITIPASVIRIEPSVFANCSSLSSVTLEPGLMYTGSNMFQSCTSLTSITIPDSMQELAAHVFSGCTALTTVELPAGLRWIDGTAFLGCKAVTGLVLPEWKNDGDVYPVQAGGGYYIPALDPGYTWVRSGWTNVSVAPGNDDVEIVDGALIDRRQLTLIAMLGPVEGECYEIPQGVVEIGDSAFMGCAGLTSVVIPDSVTKIGDNAFSGCTDLTSVVIPASVTEIGHSAFRGCTGLTSVVIPDSVTEIGDYAFSGCTGLTSVEIRDGVTAIGEGAFEDCDALTAIEIPGSVKTIGQSAFSHCANLESVVLHEGVVSVGEHAFYECYALKNLVLPGSLQIIGETAFLYTSPRSVTVSDQLARIDSDLLYEYSMGRGTLTITPAEAQIVMRDGCVFDMGGKRLIRYDSASTAESYTIPAGVEIIASRAFYRCENLRSVVIPEGVTTIETYAFYDCEALQLVNIPDSVTSVGLDAFFSCFGLKEIHIGSGVTHLPYLGGINNLAAHVKVMNVSLQRSYPNPFRLFSELTTITVSPENPVYGTIDGMLFNKTTGELLCCPAVEDGVLVIPEEITSIGSGALADCMGLTALCLPDTLQPGREGDLIPTDGLPESCTLIRLPAGLSFRLGQAREVYLFPEALTEERWNQFDPSADRNVAKMYERVEPDEAQQLYPALQPGTAVWQLTSDRAKMPIRNLDRLHKFFAAQGYTLEDYALDTQLTIGWRGVSMYPNEILCDLLGDVPSGATLIIPTDDPLAAEWALQQGCRLVLASGNDMTLFRMYLSMRNGIVSGDYMYSVSDDGLATITGCTSPESVLQIPESLDGYPVTNLDVNAWIACPQLTTVGIPARVGMLKENPFAACKQLASVQVSSENPVLATIDGVLFGKSERTLICYPAAMAGSSYSVPRGIRGIGPRAFSGCTELKRITLPDSIEHIAKDAFVGCEGITFVVIRDSYAHQYCVGHGLDVAFSDTPDWLAD